MKILLVSDSHGNNTILHELAMIYPNMDYYWHAGDSEAASDIELNPFSSIRGNCDRLNDFRDSLSINSPKGIILMKHKPYLSLLEINEGVKIFIHGHTHSEECSLENGILYLCPGAISYSRKGPESYMILEINEGKIIVTLCELNTKKVLYKREIL